MQAVRGSSSCKRGTSHRHDGCGKLPTSRRRSGRAGKLTRRNGSGWRNRCERARKACAALTSARAQAEETERANEEAHTAERKRLEEALRASEESLATLTFAKAQLEETQRTSDETHTAECKRLEEALQASEESVASLTTAKAQIEQTHRTSEEAHSAERRTARGIIAGEQGKSRGLGVRQGTNRGGAHGRNASGLEEALQAKEASLAALTSAKAQIEETHRTSEETHTAERKRLEESLHASEERVNALTAARAQSEEALRAAEERQTR